MRNAGFFTVAFSLAQGLSRYIKGIFCFLAEIIGKKAFCGTK